MSWVDWLLLTIFGVPLCLHAGAFWRSVFDEAVLAVRRRLWRRDAIKATDGRNRE